MSVGTITLTNNWLTVTGSGTTFTKDLKPGDFIVSVVGGVTYTLAVETVDSDTKVMLLKAYDGPTQASAAWSAVPRDTMSAITAQLAAETAKALRGLNLDKDNWQKLFSGTGDVTVRLPDGSSFSGPAWNSFNESLNNKADKTEVDKKADKTAVDSLADEVEKKADKSLLGKLAAKDIVSTAELNDELKSNKFAGGGGVNNYIWKTGIYSFNDNPFGFAELGNMIHISNNPDWQHAQEFGTWHNYLMFSVAGDLGVMAITDTGDTSWRGPYTVRTTKNTTVDANGFIKQASPIARIANSPESMNDDFLNGFNLSGCAAINEEADGVSAERVSTGVYRISGSNGFSAEGWTVEVPQDVNGNRLCFVAVEIDDNSVITLRVNKRKFDIDRAMVVAGEPMDIPDGRWIDLRLEMPDSKDK